MTVATGRRITLERGQFVAYRGNKFARLDHILAHEPLRGSRKWFVFLVVTPLADTGKTEPLTGLPILKPAHTGSGLCNAVSEEDCSQDIIGLSAVGQGLYMMPYITASPDGRRLAFGSNKAMELTESTELLHVNWRIHFG
ncbi:hypothetical protein B0T16DRAFT_397232 [Cercophora newfieldiana]|uniref:Uncharacterized protein n=1 Tax=Cercophora newfieldiana TaxID=92897 RepID=A0AA40D018_9PEZI|nr:hypothetical protein B0T16DRAFT_397232 [Cercophora newfieldiana]